MKKVLSIHESKGSVKLALLLALLAFVFAFAVRLIWVEHMAGNPNVFYNGEIMINTNDGYYYAEGAADRLSGTDVSINSPTDLPLSVITAFLHKVIPVSFETLILYMPAFFGALLAVPLVFLGREFGSLEGGFIAAVLGSITHSYYNRTMVGYYDTDMMILFIAASAAFFYVKMMKEKKFAYLFFAVVFILFGLYYYPNLKFIFVGFGAVYLVLGLLNKEYKDRFFLFSLAILFVASPVADLYIKLPLLTLFVALFFSPLLKNQKALYAVAGAGLLFFLLLGFYGAVSQFLGADYFERNVVSEGNFSLHYFSVVNTIREAGNIPFTVFADRISGHTAIFLLSLLGVFGLAFYDRRFLLMAPFLVLGYFALRGGLRFTIYAVPVHALGFGFLVVYAASVLRQYFNTKFLYYGVLFVMTAGALLPNVLHILAYNVPTVFTKNEVETLEKLKKIASPKSFGVSWWDYGYPIRYYGDINTFVDGGKHEGKDNFVVSYAFATDSQAASAEMSKLYANYTLDEHNGDINASNSFVEYEMQKEGFKNPYDLFEALGVGAINATAKEPVYYVLPYRMFEILPTVYRFSEVNLLSGDMEKGNFYYYSNRPVDRGNMIVLGNGLALDKASASLFIGQRKIAFKRFTTVSQDASGVHINIDEIDPNSTISLIFMQNYGAFLVMDEAIYNSVFVQLFVFENYDKAFFEPVIMTPLMKIYKLK